MSEISHYDVAVIGYGPTGVTAANLLGAQGLRVVVVERDAAVYARARAISTDEEVLRIWQQVGLAEELQRDMVADLPIDFVDRLGRPFLSASFDPAGHGYPPQLFIYQPVLEDTLRKGVARFPNVDLLLEHECLRLRQDADGVELLLADGEQLKRVRASWVVAADGGSSPTRGQLGIGFDGRTYETRWVVIDTEVNREWPDHDRLRFHCDPRRPAVDCPTPLGHHRWEFPVLPGEDEQELVSDAAVWRLLGRQGITRDHVTVLRAVVYSHHVRAAARWRVGRVFLAGDAAHAMPPWIGQGMAAGVRDAANLCWKLAAVVRGELPAAVLDSYEVERKPHVREVTRRAVLVGRIITERRPVACRIRDTLFRAVAPLSPVLRVLVKLCWLPLARYPQGFLGSGTSAVGHKVPQPWVLDSDSSRRRLDDVLAGSWTVLRTATALPAPEWTASGAVPLTVLPPGTPPEPGGVVDINGTLLAWMRSHRTHVLALRPDGFAYAAANATTAFASPPIGLRPSATVRG
ncbi:bifunctional 3-(3-hydroxy-phenyl)propionate/3-hydroxycinnamic acid hydroxylase [Kutzneria buriramensis]|uniref:3-(3-hydroxy-phenyl)propionate hydroxylase n=1 Tax=Kutzneria buriramensis TaxID=1045776 RepID=A0A3E0H4B7_9PSEU|nr:bifunctional 3-(3-hydroxy-phenyl)propionate/3-hydroxycinnamic acid hydroxylase [Kutzneria buriramensis]REH38077.1 3-(3-hydroxy-phenyl)propionate hydroxylase [Kutzneria buriramensis]